MRGARVAIAIMLSSTAVLAQPTEQDKALALTLFKRGRELMEGKKIAEACESFAESHRLDPGGGTLLNLAVCHEEQGRTATAWAEYSDAVALARRDRRTDRVELALARMAALEPKLSRLVISPPAGEGVRDLRITRDGAEVPRAAWSIAIPVDPGAHAIDAFVGGTNVFHADVEIASGGDARTVDVVLSALDAAPPPAPEPARPPAQPSPAVAERPSSGGSARAVLGWSLVGAGALSVGAGAWLGIGAVDKRNDSDAGCIAGRCTAAAAEDNARAESLADASTVTIGLGVAVLAAGVVLLVWNPSR